MISPTPPGTRRLMPFERWPERDRSLWQAGTTYNETSWRRPYAATRSAATISGAVDSYGRWLTFLIGQGLLDPDRMPVERVTRVAADAYLGELLAGNANSTIKTRFWQLRSALRIMQPEQPTDWLTKPGDWSLHMLLPSDRKLRELIGTERLFRWGLAMIEEAGVHVDAQVRARLVRNGLIIAILAARAPRLRSLTGIHNGEQLEMSATAAWLRFAPADIKTRRRIEYELPEELMPPLRHYLEVERQDLLDGAKHDALWVSTGGTPMTMAGISVMVRRASMVEFGRAFGTHSFRHELASTLAEADPDNPALAAAVLGISARVAERIYAQPRRRHAARDTARVLADDRAATADRARHLFGSCRIEAGDY